MRQDPREPRLLFTGTRSTVYVSLDGGAQWQPLKLVNASADFAEPDGKVEDEWKADFDKDKKRVRGPVAYLIDGNETTGWRADRGPAG